MSDEDWIFGFIGLLLFGWSLDTVFGLTATARAARQRKSFLIPFAWFLVLAVIVGASFISLSVAVAIIGVLVVVVLARVSQKIN